MARFVELRYPVAVAEIAVAAAVDTPVDSYRRTAVLGRLLAAGDLESPESARNADSKGATDSAGVAGWAAVILGAMILPAVAADRKVEAARIDPRLVDPGKNDCLVGVAAVLAEARLWDHYLSNFWERRADPVVAPESLAVVKEDLASPAEE